MATRVRQIVPMAGPQTVRFSGRVYVTDDAEAVRLAAAGFAEVLEGGLPDGAIDDGMPAEVPDGAMGGELPAEVPERPKYERMRKAELVAIATERGIDAEGTNAQLVERLRAADEEAANAGAENPAAAGENDHAGGEAGGDSEQPSA